MMMQKEFGRLPKWAQMEIETLRRRVQYLERAGSPAPHTNTTCGIEVLGTKRDLPDGSYVQFYQDRKSGKNIEAHMHRPEKTLYLVGDGRLIVSQPCADVVKVMMG